VVVVDVMGFFRAPSGIASGTVTSVGTGAGLTGGIPGRRRGCDARDDLE
jgi:hypothetical protein